MAIVFFAVKGQQGEAALAGYLQTGNPEPYSLVSGGRGHQVTRGREVDAGDGVFVPCQAIRPHLRLHVPDHHTRVLGARG